MNKLIDITGKRFGLLTVINKTDSFYTDDKVHTIWVCRCDCGQIKKAKSANLRKNGVKTCGATECKRKLKERSILQL